MNDGSYNDLAVVVCTVLPVSMLGLAVALPKLSARSKASRIVKGITLWAALPFYAVTTVMAFHFAGSYLAGVREIGREQARATLNLVIYAFGMNLFVVIAQGWFSFLDEGRGRGKTHPKARARKAVASSTNPAKKTPRYIVASKPRE